MPQNIDRVFREYSAAIADDEMVEAAEIYANYCSDLEFLAMVKVYHAMLNKLRD